MHDLTKWLCLLSCGAALAACGDSGDTGNQNENGNHLTDLPTCGDGVVEGWEECDDGEENSDTLPDACRTSCEIPFCGDHVVDTGEECDDGNELTGDGCGRDCLFEECGNGVLDPGEVCDDGNTIDGDGCSLHCVSDESCGNGIVDEVAGEACDDGNNVGGDGCSPDCLSVEICGNGYLDWAAGEQCDDGDTVPGDGCSASCLLEECGNGILDPGEVCDDGNQTSGDGCSADCQSDETCGNGVVDTAAGEECDDQNLVSGDGCSAACNFEYCGNGIVDAGEACDDENHIGGDGCSPDCLSSEVCGNGYVDNAIGEQCDDGNTDAGDGCGPTCRIEYCGNGVVDPGEVCDDGNTVSHDGCRHDCLSDEACGNGVLDSGEECDDGNHKSHDGCSSGCTTETRQWVERFYATRPPGRRYAGMVYDSTRQRVLLFGGMDDGNVHLNDTWALDQDGWVELQPAQTFTPREAVATFYDSVNDLVVLAGGGTLSGYFNDCWLFDGSDWSAGPQPSWPGATEAAGGVYDPVLQRGLVFGGAVWGSGMNNINTIWDGTGWTSSPGGTISARAWANLVYDSARDTIVLFGGYTNSLTWLVDAWENGPTWVPTAAPASGSGTASSLAYDEAAGNTVLVLHSLTWVYDGTTWSQSASVTQPPTRWAQSMVYDAHRDRIILFGGISGTYFMDDTWEYRWQSAWPDEVCDNGIDDDGDNWLDCEDPDCDGRPCAGGAGTCSAGTCQ